MKLQKWYRKLMVWVLSFSILLSGWVMPVKAENKPEIIWLPEGYEKEWHYPFFSEGLAVAEKKGKWGYIDKSGKVVIPLEYDNAYSFHEGLAEVEKDGKWGYIDKRGKIVIPFEYGPTEPFAEPFAEPFSEGLAGVRKDGKKGYIDKRGKVVIPFEYKWAYSFHEGLAEVVKDEKWGYIDKSGKVVIPLEYDEASSFQEDLAVVRKGEKWGYIDKSGKVVIPLEYDETYSFQEGLAAVRKGEKWGYINKNGKVVIPLEYDWAYSFHEGVAFVEKGDRLGILKNPLTQPAPAPLFPELEAAVRLAVGKLSGELTDGDWQKLTALNLSGRHLSSLSGLDKAKNLREIDLSFARVKDIMTLAQLSGLRTVILKNSNVPADQLKTLKEKMPQTEFRVLTIAITDPNVKQWNTAVSGEELVSSAESIIADAGQQKLTAADKTFVITKQMAESGAQKAEAVKEQLNAKASLENKELNRSLETIVKVSLTPEKEQTSAAIRLSKDIPAIPSIDRMVIEALPEVTLELTAGDLQNLAAADMEIEITEAGTDTGRLSADKNSAFGGDSKKGKSYKLTLKKANTGAQITLALQADQDPYNTICRKDAAGKEEIIGGRYDGKTQKLNVKISDDGEYYVRRNEKNFSDIEALPQKEKESIKVLAAKGILQGNVSGQFSPDAPIQRSEILTILVRMSYAYDSSANSTFSDVAKGIWYYPYISSGVKLGAVNGYPDNSFKPGNSVGAAELAKMNCMMLVYKKGYHFPREMQSYLAKLAQGSNVPEWAKAYIAMAEREGLLLKTANGLYDGGQAITRRQAAEMLYRLYEKL